MNRHLWQKGKDCNISGIVGCALSDLVSQGRRFRNNRLFWNSTLALFPVYSRCVLVVICSRRRGLIGFFTGGTFRSEGGQGLVASQRPWLVGGERGGSVECCNSFKTFYFRLPGLGILFGFFSFELSISLCSVDIFSE